MKRPAEGYLGENLKATKALESWLSAEKRKLIEVKVTEIYLYLKRNVWKRSINEADRSISTATKKNDYFEKISKLIRRLVKKPMTEKWRDSENEAWRKLHLITSKTSSGGIRRSYISKLNSIYNPIENAISGESRGYEKATML